MFETLPKSEPDAIFAVLAMFRNDPRPEKLDLSVGVYRDASGGTPVFAAIREAEARLNRDAQTKAYVGFSGDAAAVEALGREALGASLMSRSAGCQSVGGTGALFMLGKLVQAANPDARVHIPTPTWPNHRAVFEAAGLPVSVYPYLDAAGRAVDFDAMCAAFERLGPGDVVVLHASCHNPAGLDPTPAQWAEIARIAERRGWLPIFDAAYTGFGDGWEADAAGMRLVLDAVPEGAAAVSCSKTFGLYRDRAGVALAKTEDAGARAQLPLAFDAFNRNIHSMPPYHGGALVRMILEDDALRSSWRAELDSMRGRMAGNRAALAEALARRPGGQGWSFLGEGRGMFALLGLTDAQVTRLREEHAVYVVPGGRINLAGMNAADADRIADAILSVVG